MQQSSTALVPDDTAVAVAGRVRDVADTWRFAGSSLVADGLLEQLPNRLGRQFEQNFPAFTQAHPLHRPALLHLQHCAFDIPGIISIAHEGVITLTIVTTPMRNVV